MKDESVARIEAVTDPRFGEDVARFGGIGLQFLSQMADENA